MLMPLVNRVWLAQTAVTSVISKMNIKLQLTAAKLLQEAT